MRGDTVVTPAPGRRRPCGHVYAPGGTGPFTSDRASRSEWQVARLNSVIGALESGQHAFAAFAAPEPAAALDFADVRLRRPGVRGRAQACGTPTTLRDSLQYLLNRRRIFEAGTLAPAPTPLVRVPVNGAEHGAVAREAGARPRTRTESCGRTSAAVEEARNAVAACRYPAAARRGPVRAGRAAGRRADGPRPRYWGLSNAGVLRQGRRVAARPGRRDPRRDPDRGPARDREPAGASSTRCPASVSSSSARAI